SRPGPLLFLVHMASLRLRQRQPLTLLIAGFILVEQSRNEPAIALVTGGPEIEPVSRLFIDRQIGLGRAASAAPSRYRGHGVLLGVGQKKGRPSCVLSSQDTAVAPITRVGDIGAQGTRAGTSARALHRLWRRCGQHGSPLGGRRTRPAARADYAMSLYRGQ